MVISTIKMTAKQFLELGEDPTGLRLELVNGEIAVTPSAIPAHGYIENLLRFLLTEHVLKHDLGEIYGDIDTIFGKHDVRRPDILFFKKNRLHLIGEKAMEGSPDLCVEILSPSSREIDREDKFKQYEAGKVANYWIVDPAKRTIEAFALKRGAYVSAGTGKDSDILHLPPFEDLALPLGRLWRQKR